MFLSLKILLLFFLLSIINCTHLHEKINNLPYNTSKSDVLDDLGRPFQIKRMRGFDYWIYKFKLNGQEYTKAILFKEGYFLKSTKKQPYPNPENLLEAAENFEEYKEAVKLIKKNRRKR